MGIVRNWAIVLVLLLFLPVNAASQTTISGSITTDTTLSAGVYLVSSTSVESGVTLTLQPGVIFKMQSFASIIVHGDLDAVGTPEQPIYFTDSRDDSVGGDTNGDLGTTQPGTSESWRISVNPGGNAKLIYVHLRYGGQHNNGAALTKHGHGSFELSDSTIMRSIGAGLRLYSTSAEVTISRNEFYDTWLNDPALFVSDSFGLLAINGNDFASNGGDVYLSNINGGVEFTGNAMEYLRISGKPIFSGISNNDFGDSGGVTLDVDSSGSIIDTNNQLNRAVHIGTGGTMTADTMLNNNWTYLLGFLSVERGVTWTIPAGTVLKLVEDSSIQISGHLEAAGTAEQPIYFTDWRDETVGVESAGDFRPAQPLRDSWDRLQVNSGGSATLRHVQIRYGGSRFRAALTKVGFGAFELSDSSITDSYDNGLLLNGTTDAIRINSNQFSARRHGLVVSNSTAPLSITNNAFAISGGNRIQLSLIGGGIELTGNFIGQGLDILGKPILSGISNNDFGSSGNISLDAASSGSIIDKDNILSRPLSVTSGTIVNDTVWSSNWPYESESLSVMPDALWTIPAGAILKLSNFAGITVYGSLNVNGTAEQPVYFTDWRDDSVGGDSNGDLSTTEPASDTWGSIRIYGNAAVRHARIRYGAVGGGSATINKTGDGAFNINDSTIIDSYGAGLKLDSTTSEIHISRNRFARNRYGIDLAGNANPTIGGKLSDGNHFVDNDVAIRNQSSTITVNANYNWWGDPSGPFHAILNPDGLGDSVSDGVDFEPFLDASPVAEAVVDVVLQMAATIARKGSSLGFTVMVTGESTAPLDGRIEVAADTGEQCSDTSPTPEAGTSVVFGCDITFTETGPRQIQAQYVGSTSHADGAAQAQGLEIMNFADLQTTIDATVLTGESQRANDSPPVIQVDFQVEIRNLGPDPATNTIVLTELLPASSSSNWTCLAFGGAVCPATSGSGDLEWPLDVPVGAGLDLYIEVPIGDPPPAELEFLVATATDRAAPNHVHDPDTSQNLALEIIGVDLLFRDDFDEP